MSEKADYNSMLRKAVRNLLEKEGTLELVDAMMRISAGDYSILKVIAGSGKHGGLITMEGSANFELWSLFEKRGWAVRTKPSESLTETNAATFEISADHFVSFCDFVRRFGPFLEGVHKSSADAKNAMAEHARLLLRREIVMPMLACGGSVSDVIGVVAVMVSFAVAQTVPDSEHAAGVDQIAAIAKDILVKHAKSN